METKINIMGLDIDMIDTKTLISRVQEYLNNDCLNVILLVNTIVLEETGRNDEYKELVTGADLIVPGDETLLSLHHVDTLKVASMVVDYSCFIQIFSEIKNEDKTMYIVAQSEKDAMQFNNFFLKYYPQIKIEGMYYDDLQQGEEVLLNEINTITPDIILFMVKSPFQESFIMENKTKMNSKLCIAIGGVLDKIAIEHKEVPELVSKIRMEKLYLWIKRNKGIKKIREIRIFKKKVEHYKNKKGGNRNGDSE